MSDPYDPELWNEELLHAALSRVRLDASQRRPLASLRGRLDELLGRPIDEEHLTIGDVALIPNTLSARPEHELAALPLHALVVVVEDLGPHRFFAVPLESATPELVRALDIAHWGTIGEPQAAHPETYPSVLRVAAGVIQEDQAEELWGLHVLDFFEEWEELDVALPSLDEVRSWAATLLPYEITVVEGLDVAIGRVCAIYST